MANFFSQFGRDEDEQNFFAQFDNEPDLTAEQQMIAGANAAINPEMNSVLYTPNTDAAYQRSTPVSESTTPVEPELNGNETPHVGLREFVEPIMTFGTSMIAEPMSGLAGLYAAPFVGSDKAAEVIEKTRDELTYMPRTQGGQKILSDIGGKMEELPEIASPVGDWVYDKTESPLLSTMAATAVGAAPDLMELATGFKGFAFTGGTKLLDDAGKPTHALNKMLSKQGLTYDGLSPETKSNIPAVVERDGLFELRPSKRVSDDIVAGQIEAGDTSGGLAKLQVEQWADGRKVKKDPIGSGAVKQGFTDGLVQSIKTANDATREKMSKMLNIMRQVKGDERLGMDMRPSDVIGESLTDRLNFIRDSVDAANTELDNIVNTRFKGKLVDPQTVTSALIESLNDMDVRVVNNNGVPQPVFDGSIIAKNPTAQKAVNDAIDLLAYGDAPDAMRVHKLKKQFDDLIDFNKTAQNPLTKEGKSFLKKIRYSLNETLRSVDPDYARVNDVISASLDKMDALDDATGSINIFGRGAEKSLGTRMRALMSNQQSRVNIDNSIDAIDQFARELGGNFDDDIKQLALFDNALNKRFGQIAETSFAGQTAEGINKAAMDAATGNKPGMIYRAGKWMYNKAHPGVNDFEAYEAMDNLINNGRTTVNKRATPRTDNRGGVDPMLLATGGGVVAGAAIGGTQGDEDGNVSIDLDGALKGAVAGAVAPSIAKRVSKLNNKGAIGNINPFPVEKATVHTTLKHINSSPTLKKFHEQAKAGDYKAAQRLLQRTVKKQKLNALKAVAKKHPDAKLLPVNAAEATGDNAIPYSLAEYISENTGLKIVDNIEQLSKAKRTGKNAVYRMTTLPAFGGDIPKGGKYILIDDHFTQGGTINELRYAIEANGGEVVDVVGLTASKGSTIIKPKKATIDKIIQKFGRENVEELIRKHDIAGTLEGLTESQAGYIARFTHFDTLRNRIDEAAKARGEGIFQDASIRGTRAVKLFDDPHPSDYKNFDVEKQRENLRRVKK